MEPNPPDDATFVDLVTDLASEAVEQILRHQDAGAFLRWMRLEAPRRYAELFVEQARPAERRAAVAALAVALWNVTPLPRNGYRPQPLPEPSWRLRCPCGTGVAYRNCCGVVPPFQPFDTEDVWFLVAEHLPERELARVARARAMPGPVAGLLADMMLENGSPRRALRLVEALFDRPQDLDAGYERALDALLDAYDELGYHRKKDRVLERLARELRPPLRGALWMRMAAVAAERRDFDAAWELFAHAQRDDPDNPSVAFLEVTLLMAADEAGRAAARARFWLRRLQRLGFGAGTAAVDFLQEVVRDPAAALVQTAEPATREHLVRFYELLRAFADRAPAPYELRPAGKSRQRVRLTPCAAVRAAERAWQSEAWPLADGALGALSAAFDAREIWGEEAAERWLSFLERHPAACDSFVVLADLCMACEQLDAPRSAQVVLDRALLAPLLDRAEALMTQSFAGAPGLSAPWSVTANRPALRLLVSKVRYLDQCADPACRELMARLVALDSDDHYGFRNVLVNFYLREGDDERVLELSEGRSANPNPDVIYGRVLALYRLGRRAEARRALAEAYRQLPLVADYLVGRRCDVPRLDLLNFRSGGADQAWLYQEYARGLWQGEPGLLEWVEKGTRRTARR